MSPGSEEEGFQKWYAGQASKLRLNPNPDDSRHFYDWRAAYRTGSKVDSSGHWPSEFKREGHPRLILGGVDTRTGRKTTRTIRNKNMSPAGYYRTSAKEAKARTARIKKRQAAAETPEGRAATAKRHLTKRAALEARMTPAERRKAERKRVDVFMQRRAEGQKPRPATPGKQVKPKTPSEEHREAARERQGRWSIFPQLTGPGGALGKKKGNK